MNSLTAKPVHPQLAQWLDSYCRVVGHEPSAQEIADFSHRNKLSATDPLVAHGCRSVAPTGTQILTGG